jgi:drug/metabolite transporter (DMT)-like permease
MTLRDGIWGGDMRNPKALDYLLLVAVGFVWGSQFVFNELAIRSYAPLTVAAGRVFIAFLTLSAAAALIRSQGAATVSGFRGQPWGLYAMIAVVETILPCFLIPLGQRHADSSVAAILLATVPLFTLFLAPILVRTERWSLPAALSVVVGFIGILVLIVPDARAGWLSDAAGEPAFLAAALCYALGLILMKRLKGIPPVIAMRNLLMVASIPLVVLSAIVDAPWRVEANAADIGALVALGVLCGGAANVMFYALVQRTGPTFTSLVGYLETLFGVSLGVALMGDALGLNDYGALALIVAALTIARWKPGASAAHPEMRHGEERAPG